MGVKKVTKQMVKDFVADHADDEVVGYAGIGNSCIIANIYKANGAAIANAGTYWIEFEEAGKEVRRVHQTPKWAADLIMRHDNFAHEVTAGAIRKYVEKL